MKPVARVMGPHTPVVYYLGIETDAGLAGIVKIGTTVNLSTRIRRMELARTSLTFVLLGYEAGGLDIEKARHRQFDDAHLLGEWFVLKPQLREHLDVVRELGERGGEA